MRRAERGAAALLGLLVLAALVGIAVVSWLEPGPWRARQAERDARVLAAARAALIERIAWAEPWDDPTDRPGELPCPDHDRDGASAVGDGVVGSRCQVYRGWFPHRLVGLDPPEDASGARLWYAVADAWQKNHQGVLNDSTPAALRLDGRPVVAVIAVPGPPLCFQTGRAAVRAAPDAAGGAGEFLEGANADGDPTEPDDALAADYRNPAGNLLPGAPCGPGSRGNDRLVAVGVEDLMAPIRQRVALALAAALETYYAARGHLPFAAGADHACAAAGEEGLLPDGAEAVGGCPGLDWPAWFGHWRDRVYYRVAPRCAGPATSGCNGPGGWLTLDGRPARAVVAVAGRPLAGADCNGTPRDQPDPRPAAFERCDYLEGAANTDGDADYRRRAHPAANDAFAAVHAD